MSLHLSILRRRDLERPKGIHKRARTTSTELMEDEPEQDAIVVLHPQVGTAINWHDLIVNQNHHDSPSRDDPEKPRVASISSAESTTFSEEEMDSLQSLMEHAEGFESGFDTFDDYLRYSSSNLDEEAEELIGDKVKTETKKNESKLKRKLKKLKAKMRSSFQTKTSFNVKQKIKSIHNNAVPILRAVANATALVFRGVLFLTVNVLIVLTVILSLAIV